MGHTTLLSLVSGRDGVSLFRNSTSIFLVPKKGSRHRPIINLKKLNEFVPHHHFKMEGIHMLKDLLR